MEIIWILKFGSAKLICLETHGTTRRAETRGGKSRDPRLDKGHTQWRGVRDGVDERVEDWGGRWAGQWRRRWHRRCTAGLCTAWVLLVKPARQVSLSLRCILQCLCGTAGLLAERLSGWLFGCLAVWLAVFPPVSILYTESREEKKRNSLHLHGVPSFVQRHLLYALRTHFPLASIWNNNQERVHDWLGCLFNDTHNISYLILDILCSMEWNELNGMIMAEQ